MSLIACTNLVSIFTLFCYFPNLPTLLLYHTKFDPLLSSTTSHLNFLVVSSISLTEPFKCPISLISSQTPPPATPPSAVPFFPPRPKTTHPSTTPSSPTSAVFCVPTTPRKTGRSPPGSAPIPAPSLRRRNLSRVSSAARRPAYEGILKVAAAATPPAVEMQLVAGWAICGLRTSQASANRPSSPRA